MPWLPYLIGTRIERHVHFTEPSVKVFLDRASEVLQERGFTVLRAEEGLIELEAPGRLWRLLNRVVPGSHSVVLRATRSGTDMIHFVYDAHHLRELVAATALSLGIFLGDVGGTMLLTIPLFFGLAWLLPYFYHIDHVRRIVNGPRDMFKHLRGHY